MQEQPNSNYKKLTMPIQFEKANVWPINELHIYRPERKPDWMHCHDCLELGRCVSGNGLFLVNDSIDRVKEQSGLIVYPGIYHTISSVSQCECHFLYINLDYFFKFFDESTLVHIKSIKGNLCDFLYVIDKDKYLGMRQLIDEIFDEALNYKADSEIKIAHLLAALLITHSRYTVIKKNANKIVDFERIAPSIDYIKTNYKEKITLNQLAKKCFMSEANLRKLYYSILNKSPMEYLSTVRIKNATLLLASSSKSVTEISVEVGYPSISSFNRKFKEYNKISPSQYRKKVLLDY